MIDAVGMFRLQGGEQRHQIMSSMFVNLTVNIQTTPNYVICMGLHSTSQGSPNQPGHTPPFSMQGQHSQGGGPTAWSGSWRGKVEDWEAQMEDKAAAIEVAAEVKDGEVAAEADDKEAAMRKPQFGRDQVVLEVWEARSHGRLRNWTKMTLKPSMGTSLPFLRSHLLETLDWKRTQT